MTTTRARLAKEDPPCCVKCGEAFREGWPPRERALDDLVAGRLPPPSLCERCLVAAEGETRRREAAEAEAARAARAERVHLNLPLHLARAGVPPVLRSAQFDRCPDLPAKLVQRVRSWAESPQGFMPQGFMLLMGPVGGGKSWLAVSALACVLGNGGAGRFVVERDWLGKVRNEYGNILVDRGPARTAFLAYDDLGACYTNDLRRGATQELLRERYDYGRPTIITSNLDLTTLDELLGSRVASVLREHGNVVGCGHLDLRQSGSLRPGRAEGAALGGGTETGDVANNGDSRGQ